MIKHNNKTLKQIQVKTESTTFISQKIDLLNNIKYALHIFTYDNGDLDLCIKNIVKAVDSYKEKTKRISTGDLSKILTGVANRVIKESKDGK